MAATTALAVLLALCVAPYAPGGVPLVVAAAAPAPRYAEAREAWRPKVPKPKRGASPHQKETEERRPNRSDRRVIPWVSVAILVIILFFFRSFAAPFFDPLGEPRQATASSVYFSLLAFLYFWLASVTVLTVLPQLSTNYNIIIATALFFYMGFVSVCALLVGRAIIRGAYYLWLFWKNGSGGHALEKRIAAAVSTISRLVGHGRKTAQDSTFNGKDSSTLDDPAQLHKKQLPELTAFQRPFRRVCKSAVAVSAGLCVIYSHCWSRSLSAFDLSREDGANIVCRAIFLPTLLFGTMSDTLKADERSIWILWVAAMIVQCTSYALNEFSGKHHRDYRIHSFAKRKRDISETAESKSSSSFDVDASARGAGSDDVEEEEDENVDKDQSYDDEDGEGADPWQSISDTIQKLRKGKVEQPEGTLPMVSWYSQIIFTTGFDMLLAFKVFLGRFDARKMQVALLKDTRTEADRIRQKSTEEGVFDFSRCSKYCHIAEEGFWFDFVSDVGDGFDSSYQVSRLLAQPALNVGGRVLPRGKLLINGGDLAYPDPTPENYEQRFFRTFEDAMRPPPSFRREHISIHKPALPVKGWMLETERNDLSSYPGPCTFLIPGNHDWFDGLSTFTRYILSRDWLGGWLMPQRTSYFALALPKGWWLLGFDLALDDDINIEQFQFFANLAEKSMKPDDAVIIVSHVPHWVLNAYENHHNDAAKESNLTELIGTHLRGRVKLRLAGDLHHYTRHVSTDEQQKEPQLIVAGGGGAFLHPTHCFQDEVLVGQEKQKYVRVCAYPSPKVSRQLSWLNLWQFRWRNWRLDVLWAITHFGVCSSLFPLCGVYDDYIQFNPTHHVGYLCLWVISRVLSLFARIFLSGRASLLFVLIILGLTCGFTDKSNLKWRTHLSWGLAHGFAHIASALTWLLFVECMAEFVLNEGLVATENVGSASTQSCGTGLATSIYDEFEEHFSHTLEDFRLLNTTNATNHEPPDLFPSCRFDESLFEMVSSTFSWLYHGAPFLKTTLSIFDLPGNIGSTHDEMCEILCSDGAECTYSHDFFRYERIDRVTNMKYLASISLYYIVFAVPLAGNIMGIWLALTLNYLNCQYDEGFSSLRMEHWKNFLKLHIDEAGDLTIFAIGLPRVPKKWRKDPMHGDERNAGRENATTQPSWMWKTPSKWKCWRTRKKFAPQIIDHTKIRKR